MYNGIGLTTPRGSGTNGHVQRNFAFVRPGKKDVNYRTEEDIAKLEATTNRQPNLAILDHERKRKIEVKCAELEEVLENQGYVYTFFQLVALLLFFILLDNIQIERFPPIAFQLQHHYVSVCVPC
jgi:hypothetical protein